MSVKLHLATLLSGAGYVEVRSGLQVVEATAVVLLSLSAVVGDRPHVASSSSVRLCAVL